jgi:HNH endonuclease/NUMOD4 motif-containing protein
MSSIPIIATSPTTSQGSNRTPHRAVGAATRQTRQDENICLASGNSFYQQQSNETISTAASSCPVAENNPDNHSTTDCEIWKSVAGYEGLYEVSSHGRVKTLRTTPRGCRAKNYPYLALNPNNCGYFTVNLSRDGKTRGFSVHRLVAAAFIGPRPDKHDVNHIDLNKTNNHAINLEYLTHQDNLQHAVKHRGSWQRKLTEQHVREIRKLLAGGVTQVEVAKRYGVSQPAIGQIKSGQIWSHVKE